MLRTSRLTKMRLQGWKWTSKKSFNSNFRELDLLFNSEKLSGTSLSSDNCTCAVIKPHAMNRAGTIIDEILNQGKRLIINLIEFFHNNRFLNCFIRIFYWSRSPALSWPKRSRRILRSVPRRGEWILSNGWWAIVWTLFDTWDQSEWHRSQRPKIFPWILWPGWHQGCSGELFSSW